MAITLYPSVTITEAEIIAAGGVVYDANNNVAANNFLANSATTATVAATTTLLVGSAAIQRFTGVTTQTVVLPVVSTLAIGQQFAVVNLSTGVVTVNSSGGNLVLAIPGGQTAIFTVNAITGTSATSWDALLVASLNGLTITTTTGTLTITNGKTLAVSNTLTLAGTDSTTMTFPPASASVGYLNIPQNAQTGSYGLVLADAGKHIYHASGAGAAAYTIPANGTIAFPIGTAITIVNESATAPTVVITTDVLHYVNVGAITQATIPQYNEITILKVTATLWLASGSAGILTS